MLTCFRCKKVISDPATLFCHIKDDHKISGGNCKVQCTLCWKAFTNFSTFKRNVLTCFNAMPDEADEIPDSRLYKYAVDEETLTFDGILNEAGIEVVCGLAAKMDWARKDVFTTIFVFKHMYLSRIISGIEEIIGPCIRPEKQAVLDNFVDVIRSSFDNVENERLLDLVLKRLEVISDLSEFDIVSMKEPKPKKRKQGKRKKPNEEATEVDGRKRKKTNDYSEESNDSEESSDSDVSEDGEVFENIEETDSIEPEADVPKKVATGSITIMPIKFQLEKFFELPDVFEKIKLNTAKILQGTKLDHFIKGRLWKEKLKTYKPDDLVIPFHFYGDGVQINNPLGPHAKSGEQQMNYLWLPTVPNEFASRLDNIFVAQLYPAKYHQRFSNEQIYNNIVEIFTALAEDGVCLNINGERVKVFFVCGCFIGDNKEQNQRLDYVGAFSAFYCCRYCKMHIDEIRTESNSLQATRRNRDNYDVDVAINDEQATGIKEYSIFNRIPLFHVTESSSADIAHDITEGVLHTVLSKSILDFIQKKYFDINYLNERMVSMDFGEMEKGNLPTIILKKKLKSTKLKMNCSEMFFFAHHLTFMIGDKVPDDDPVWQLLLTTIKFFDLCYLPAYGEDDINGLQTESNNLNKELMDIFNVDLKHKSHLCTHYHELTLDFGPLRYVQTIRFEGKHKVLKSYAKNTNSRLNISLSMAKKMLYNFAYRLLRREGLEDRILIPKHTSGSIEKKVYYSRLISSGYLNEILQNKCFFATKIVVNGIIFSMDLWLPNFEDDANKQIQEIVDIVILDLNDITKMFVVCKTYSVTYDGHYHSYVVQMESLQNEMKIINVREFLEQHHYPVKLQNVKNNFMFRTKRF